MSSFKTWLSKQEDRKDQIGDVARFIAKDTSVPDSKLRGIVKYLKEHETPKYLLGALEKAHAEWYAGELSRSRQPESRPVEV